MIKPFMKLKFSNLKILQPFKNSDKSFSKLFETDDIKWKLYVENNKDGYLSCFIQLNLET